MRASQATAGVFTRLTLALLTIVALACGGGTEPPGDTGAVGLWNATVATHGQLPLGGPVACSVSWAMKIEDFGGTGAPELFTTTPFTPQITCDNGFTGPWEYRAYNFLVYQDGDNVVFLTPSRLDTFLVATVSGSSMIGTIGKYFYQDGSFRATRRSGPDPNLDAAVFRVGAYYPDLEIGDTLRAGAYMEDGYGRQLDTIPVAWTSSVPAHATVDPNGLMHGVSPGTTWIVGQGAGLRDSFSLTVLPPAASVEITSAPDSLLVPQGWQVLAVAKDGGGQSLPDRRLTWESSNPAVATVDPGGIVAAVAPGTVTITARSTVVSASRTFPVLPAAASITLTSAGTVVPLGGTLQVTATVKDAQGTVLTGRPVHWETDDAGIISVNQTGLLTGVTAGTTNLVTTVEDVSAVLVGVSAQMDGPLTAVALGDRHTCGVATTGHVYCWGGNDLGQLGPTAPGFVGASLVPSAEHFASIAANGSHTCALNTAGAAFCWGYNSFGQVGGTPSGVGEMVAVSGGLAFTRLSAGSEFTCGLSSGAAFCWGLNGLGQLGRGTDDLTTHTAPAAVVGGHAFTAVAAGDRTACGLAAGGQAWCWGSNESGQLGLGTQDTGPHSTPVHAAPALTFTAIAPGKERTCGITTGSGVVQCWGGSAGLDPAPVDATTGYVEIAAGGSNFCRVNGAGAISCLSETGLVPPNQTVSGVKLGARHGCARVTATGRVVCWGDDESGQLGSGSFTFGPVEPTGQP